MQRAASNKEYSDIIYIKRMLDDEKVDIKDIPEVYKENLIKMYKKEIEDKKMRLNMLKDKIFKIKQKFN